MMHLPRNPFLNPSGQIIGHSVDVATAALGIGRAGVTEDAVVGQGRHAFCKQLAGVLLVELAKESLFGTGHIDQFRSHSKHHRSLAFTGMSTGDFC